jgi:hypothetical protein
MQKVPIFFVFVSTDCPYKWMSVAGSSVVEPCYVYYLMDITGSVKNEILDFA